MESIAYMVTNKFIIIAVDTNLEVFINDEKKVKNDAQKISVLLDNIAFGCIGENYKASDIYNYIWKLNELGNNNTYDEIIEDLEVTFGTSNMTNDMLSKQAKLFEKFTDSQGILNPNDVLNHIQNDEIMYPFVLDIFMTMQGNYNPTSIALFSKENNPFKIRVGNYSITGNHMVGNEIVIPENHVFIHCLSAKSNDSVIAEQVEKAYFNVNKSVTVNWEKDNDAIDKLIDAGKISIKSIIETISPFTTKPNVVIYELSKNTNYIFQEPEAKLVRYNFNRPPSEE